jgi:hypothetical protein
MQHALMLMLMLGSLQGGDTAAAISAHDRIAMVSG